LQVPQLRFEETAAKGGQELVPGIPCRVADAVVHECDSRLLR